MRLKQWVGNLYQALGTVQGGVIVVLSLFLAFLVFVQVLLRYVFKAPLMGIEELMLFPTIWLYMIGGANASYERNHIECGILTLYIKRPVSQYLFNIVKNLISLCISIWLTYWAYWYFQYSLKLWKTSQILYIPMFYAESALFVGLVLMTIHTITELGDNTKKFAQQLRAAKRER